MPTAIIGAGLVGQRCAEILTRAGVNAIVTCTASLPSPAEIDSVVLAIESRAQVGIARQLVEAGVDVVSTADDPTAVQQLWNLGPEAEAAGARLIVGAAYSPGLSSLLVSRLAADLDLVTTISTAQFGTGGPTCARQHHRSMAAPSQEVHQGQLRPTRGGSGRALVWFPDPVGPADCYRGGLAEPWLLHRAFPEVPRIESRQAATRRDRLTMRLPMLRPPHTEGLLGAVWAEVRGRRDDGTVSHSAMAASAPQATGAAAMAAAVVCWLGGASGSGGEGSGAGVGAGVLSVAQCPDPSVLLAVVSKEIRLWAYDGSKVRGHSEQYDPPQIARKGLRGPKRR